MLKRFICVVSLLALSLPVLSKNDEKAMSLLLQNLSAFTGYQAKFSQQSLDERGQPMQAMKMTGTLMIKKPNRFYWQADEPAAQLLVCDGQTIWHFDEDLEQVVVQKYAQAKYQSPLLLILEEEGALREKFDVSLVTQAPLLVFTLTPKKIQGQQNEAMAVSSIELGFSDNKLQSLSFVDALKQKTQVNFTEVVIDQVIDDKRFTFDIPVDADVLYE